MNNQDKMREEFEKWAVSDGYELEASSDERFTYAFHETECAWYGWQASRAAVCVDLPMCTNESQDAYYRELVDELELLGVKYK